LSALLFVIIALRLVLLVIFIGLLLLTRLATVLLMLVLLTRLLRPTWILLILVSHDCLLKVEEARTVSMKFRICPRTARVVRQELTPRKISVTMNFIALSVRQRFEPFISLSMHCVRYTDA
jgi:hypothetical protein